MSYSAFGADAWCTGKQVGDVCDEHARCDADLVCSCEASYLMHPTTQKCITGADLCSGGSSWSTSKGQCVAGGLSLNLESAAWVLGGAALGIGVMLLLGRGREATT